MNNPRLTAELLGKITGIILAVLILSPLILCWVNHVFIQYPIAYYQYVVLAILVGILNQLKTTSKAHTLMLAATLICQVLAWINLIQLPLFHITK